MFMGRKNALVTQGRKSHEPGPFYSVRADLVRVKLRTSKRSSAGPQGPAANAAAMNQYGGQLMTTGAQAQTYACLLYTSDAADE